MNSPITPTEAARDYFRSKGLIDRLRSYWLNIQEEFDRGGKTPEPYEVQMRFANGFGEELWTTICTDLSLERGACLLAAIEVAREIPLATAGEEPEQP